jgi:glycine/D-amino acid oxidase-like deaminating enzyme
MDRVKRVEALSGYRLRVEFTDGVRGEVDLSDRLFGPVFEPLRDRELFTQVSVDEFGAVCWPNGADLAPDALHARLAASVRASSG